MARSSSASLVRSRGRILIWASRFLSREISGGVSVRSMSEEEYEQGCGIRNRVGDSWFQEELWVREEREGSRRIR